MTEETKKYLSIGLAVVCISIAGTIFYRSMFGGGSGDAGSDQDVALLCRNCGGFEIPVEEFRELMSTNPAGMMMGMPGQPIAMECPKCGQKACYMAHKCLQCANIFVLGQAKDRNYPDRCPKCGISEIEGHRKNQ